MSGLAIACLACSSVLNIGDGPLTINVGLLALFSVLRLSPRAIISSSFLRNRVKALSLVIFPGYLFVYNADSLCLNSHHNSVIFLCFSHLLVVSRLSLPSQIG